jgi:hypothetical protein
MAAAFLDVLGKYVPSENYTERFYTVRGNEFHQVFQGFPALAPFYMDWEKNYNAEKVFWFIVDNPWIPWFSLCIYLLFIFGYPALAKRYNIGYISARTQMACWNFFLASFSWIGAMRVVPHFFFLLKDVGFEEVGRKGGGGKGGRAERWERKGGRGEGRKGGGCEVDILAPGCSGERMGWVG